MRYALRNVLPHIVARVGAVKIGVLLLAGGVSVWGWQISAEVENAPTTVASNARPTESPTPVVGSDVRECQALGPAAPHPIWAVDSASSGGCGEVGWDARGMTDWQQFAHGEYVGHARTAHVPRYRLRPGDQLVFAFRRTREQLGRAYELQIGDQFRIESLTAGRGPATRQRGDQPDQPEDALSRQVVIQPDGTVSLPLIGEIHAVGRSVASLRNELEEKYKKYYRVPAITITAIEVNTKLVDLLASVDARGGVGGLQFQVTVSPGGAVMLPGIGRVFVQGLSVSEVKMEVDARYDATIPGVQVTPIVDERAPRFIYVLGEVAQPGQFELQGPTSAMQAIALAGGWNIGSNLRQVVVFRRGEDWRLMATMLDLKGALYARRPTPADDIWLNDSDIILIPKAPIAVLDEFIEMAFTRGLYAAIPIELIWGQGFSSISSITSN